MRLSTSKEVEEVYILREIKAGTPFTLQRFVKLTQYQPSDPNYRQAVLIVNGQQQGVALTICIS